MILTNAILTRGTAGAQMKLAINKMIETVFLKNLLSKDNILVNNIYWRFDTSLSDQIRC